MNTKKLTIENITIEDLIREALTIPNGWKKEVHVEADGTVTFTSPMTPNTWTGKTDNPREPLDSYVGDLHSISWGDIEGFYERKDGKIERDNPYDGEAEGEYYEKANILTVDEAIEELATYLDNDASEVAQLINRIQEDVSFTVQGYMNGEATDIALLPKAALPERLDEAKYDEEQDVFYAPRPLFAYIASHPHSCEVIKEA
jgi:hypothetical protein